MATNGRLKDIPPANAKAALSAVYDDARQSRLLQAPASKVLFKAEQAQRQREKRLSAFGDKLLASKSSLTNWRPRRFQSTDPLLQ
eukprot:3062568-Pyramimonas_sp.AAC.1